MQKYGNVSIISGGVDVWCLGIGSYPSYYHVKTQRHAFHLFHDGVLHGPVLYYHFGKTSRSVHLEQIAPLCCASLDYCESVWTVLSPRHAMFKTCRAGLLRQGA